MDIKFWGCRGSIPRSRRDMMRYGGATSCVHLRTAEGSQIVLDLGSGAQDLGNMLMASGAASRGTVLITHTHWDHIQGFPFFSPLFVPGNRWDVYGPRGLGGSLRETLSGQMQYQYFPVTLEQMGAEVAYHDLVEGEMPIGDTQVRAQYLNHPALTLGYRIEADGVSVVYATDHEPFHRALAVDGYTPGNVSDDRHVEFLSGADLLIHDAQYTAAEYPPKKGWGHSTVEYVVDIALAGGVRRLALFHHDPMRTDTELDELVVEARRRVEAKGRELEVFAASDGRALTFRPRTPADRPRARMVPSAIAAPAFESDCVLLALRDPARAVAVAESVRDDGLEVRVLGDARSVLEEARAKRPSLLLVDRNLMGENGFDLCRKIRETDEWGRDVPFVVVAADRSDVDEAAGDAAGVTDWLIEPYTGAYARTRIRAWILRAACRWQCAPLPEDEAERLAALRASGILDSSPEARFDRITRIAARLFDVPIAVVSLVDEDRQWFKSAEGLEAKETPRDQAFCAHAIHKEDVTLIPDAMQDDRFADNPLVTGAPHVRFYAGCPIHLDRYRVGTLCLIDHRARDLDPKQLELFRDLGRMVERELQDLPSA